MKGDFTRTTFDAVHHFSRVLMQQGRVTIDADPNEQAAILLHYVRTLARDLIGPRGGPDDFLGFELSTDTGASSATLTIGAGRYYVDGFLCENDEDCFYDQQPDYPLKDNDTLRAELLSSSPKNAFWVYLDVWERHITPIEDDRIREVALGGPDTCTRAKVVWQVKALVSPDPADTSCTGPLDGLTTLATGRMAAELDPGQQIKDPCVVAPDARFRGAENQLYRVEIHEGSGNDNTAQATFKWSRGNGSVATAWLGTEANDLLVASARGFSAGAWVELSSDTQDLLGEPGVLIKLSSVDGNRLSVDPSSVPPPPGGSSPGPLPSPAGLPHPKVRRWDQTENDDITLPKGAIPINTNAIEPNWIDLEDGVRLQFRPGTDTKIHFRSGDYWLIPARVATGEIEWPRTASPGGGSTADFLLPRGIEHHYAPLGRLRWSPPSDGNNHGEWTVTSCLCTLQQIVNCAGNNDAVTPRRPPPPKPTAPSPTPAPAPTATRSTASAPKPPGPKPK